MDYSNVGPENPIDVVPLLHVCVLFYLLRARNDDNNITSRPVERHKTTENLLPPRRRRPRTRARARANTSFRVGKFSPRLAPLHDYKGDGKARCAVVIFRRHGHVLPVRFPYNVRS